MTTIKPITSEEVLARQVKEGSLAAQQQNAQTAENEQDGAVPTTQTAKQSPPPEIVLVPEDSIDQPAGFTYRLPVGAHLLAFMYLQIAVASLLIGVLNTVLYTQYSLIEATPIWEIINKSRELWIVLIISSLVSIFIISGRKILRWFAIATCTVLTITMGYQIYLAVSSITENDYISSSLVYLSSSVLAVTGPLIAGVILTSVTILYLLRKKIAAVYE